MPDHPSQGIQRAANFLPFVFLRTIQKLRPAFVKDESRAAPSNEAIVAERFPDITRSTPSPRSGCETFTELSQTCSEVSEEQRQHPTRNPQVAEEGHLDMVKRDHLEGSRNYPPAVYEAGSTTTRTYLQRSRTKIQKALAMANKFSGIINPSALEGMARARMTRRGRPTMPSSPASPHRRMDHGARDPPASHILAGKHFERNARVRKPTERNVKMARSVRFRDKAPLDRPTPEAIRFALPHPPTSPHEADFVPSRFIEHHERYVAHPREVPEKVYDPTRPSPLRNSTAIAAPGGPEELWEGKSKAPGGVEPGPGACPL